VIYAVLNILRKLKHDVSGGWRVPDGYVDLFDACFAPLHQIDATASSASVPADKTTRTFYEIEFSHSPKYRVPGFEIIIVDRSKLPKDIDEIRKVSKSSVLDNNIQIIGGYRLEVDSAVDFISLVS